MQSAFSWAPKVVRKCESKHWYACGADGRSVGRPVGHVITKFSGMGRFIYQWCSAIICPSKGLFSLPSLFFFFLNNLANFHSVIVSVCKGLTEPKKKSVKNSNLKEILYCLGSIKSTIAN